MHLHSTSLPRSKQMLHYSLLLVFLVKALAQTSCPNCDQSSDLPSFTTSSPIQTATAKLKITFNAPSTNCVSGNCNTNKIQTAPIQVQAPPGVSTSCFGNNCGAPVYSSGCTSGKCNNLAPIVVRSSNGCSSGNCNNVAPIIVRAPSFGCFGNNCGARPIILPTANFGCSGFGCTNSNPIIVRSPILNNYAPIIRTAFPRFGFGCRNNGCNTFSTSRVQFGVPDPVTINNRFIRPRIMVPTRYDNGNPVFTINGGYGRK